MPAALGPWEAVQPYLGVLAQTAEYVLLNIFDGLGRNRTRQLYVIFSHSRGLAS
jgi:hypothetical protein